MTVVTSRVLMPWRYVLKMAALRATTLRLLFFKSEVRNGMSLLQTSADLGPSEVEPLIQVRKLRGFKPLVWPLRDSYLQ
jgi:hypothetical protein